MEKITEIKAEVFDILLSQDNLRFQIQKLEEKKASKLKELEEEIAKFQASQKSLENKPQ